VDDTASGFSSLRRETKFFAETNTKKIRAEYSSLISLENTSRNSIRYMEGEVVSVFSYGATIIDSVTEVDAHKVCDEWKDNIAQALGKEFEIRKNGSRFMDVAGYGWILYNGQLEIIITIYPIRSPDLNTVSMVIDYMVYNIK